MTGYVYDAEGRRVAKGTITSWSCDPSTNGFSAAVNETDYVLDQAGHQVTEMASSGNGSMTWAHTNVWAGNKLLATYDPVGLHFYSDDPLETRRVTTGTTGVVEQSCSSQPYGDGETCTSTPTEHLFTGKERDAESGNDYFGARYYGPTMGRFLTPDWSKNPQGVPYADYTDPQSLNLYQYMRDNPLDGVDPDGHMSNWDPDFQAQFAVASMFDGAGLGAGSGQRAQQQAQQQNTEVAQEEAPESPEVAEQEREQNALEPVKPGESVAKMGNVYDAMHPGPLPDDIAKTFSGGEYVEFTVGKDGLGVDNARVYGGKAGPLGRN
ncbi:MAG: RHS repeat-associated core domain-containing protein, partial [Acidobacteriaceae bacterium]